MTTLFISHHLGALDWATAEGIIVDQVIDHLDPQIIQPGDVVIGTLPIHLAAQVCQRGGRYLHLSVDAPHDWRRRELSADDLCRFGARLEEYQVSFVSSV